LLDQIWHQYHTSLLSFIRRRVDVDDLAEDILQDVFIKAHSRLAQADRIQSWLYQIARNTIIDYHRTRRSAEPLPDKLVQQPGRRPSQAEMLALFLRRREEPRQPLV